MSTPNTHYGAQRIEKLLRGCRHLFFIGIGGVSMSSLAEMSRLRGYTVSGSDRGVSAITEKLEKDGIKVFYGHDGGHLVGVDAIVYTVAIGEDNPEYAEAKRVGIPLISRADYLGYIMTSWKNRIGIAGMHGKSTCTSMCAAIWLAAMADPTVVSGASYAPMGGYYRIGKGKSFVFEACEYMDSFLDFNPTTAVILNVELEHVDYFGSIERIRESYGKFAAITGEGGRIIYNADDENAEMSVAGLPGEKITFGLDRAKNPDFTAINIDISSGRPSFDIEKGGKYLCHVDMRVSGKHNIYNALAAAAAADSDGISPEAIAKGLGEFSGAGRRMEYRGRLNGSELYDDYGHHPTEVKATLEGARGLCGGRDLVCVFQPHTYSRTAALFEDFAAALSTADRVYLAPIYAARETDDLGVSSAKLAEAIGEKARSAQTLDELAKILEQDVRANDLTLIMGAGNIVDIFGKLERTDVK